MVRRFPRFHRIAFLLLALTLLPALAVAGPHPDCTCEFCLENIGAKCTPPGGGVASCSSLIIAGVCLGQFTSTGTAAPEMGEEVQPQPLDAVEVEPISACEPAGEARPDLD